MEDLQIQYNRSYKELDIIYHRYAASCGLSDSAFWLLYYIADQSTKYTQREICADWSVSPQTINTALKQLEQKQIVTLKAVGTNRKNKVISLTSKGIKLVSKTIQPVLEAEQNAFASLKESEQKQLLKLTQKQIALLRESMNQISSTSSED